MEILKYTHAHNLFRERLQAFLATEVTPFADQWEANKIVPKSVWRKMGQSGFLCTDVAPQYGGMGGGVLDLGDEGVGRTGFRRPCRRRHGFGGVYWILEAWAASIMDGN